MHLPRAALAALTLTLSPLALAAPPTAPANKPEAKKPARVFVLEIRNDDGLRASTRLNGFRLDDLVSTRERDELLRDFPWAHEASVVPPYMLRAQNTVTAEAKLDESLVADDDQGPWWFEGRLALHDVGPDDRHTDVEPKPLAAFRTDPLQRGNAAPKKASARFDSPVPLPVWAWTKAPVITPDAKTLDEVYAALTAFHAGLKALADDKTPGADKDRFMTSVRAQTADYRASCELYGKKDTSLDELLGAAASLGLPDDAGIRAAVAQEAKNPRPPRTAPVHDEMPQRTPADYAMPHLTLGPLPAKSEVKLDLIGDGRLARLLHVEQNRGVGPTFFSNWPDGGWGARGDDKVRTEVWFRKNAAGGWDIDAVVNARHLHLQLLGSGMDSLLESSGLR